MTSLRWFAASLVFLRHIDDTTRFAFHGLAEHGMRQGVQGVAFFFVLSGFVLTWSSSDVTRRGVANAKSFWRRRVARIYPAYFVACLLAIAFLASIHHVFGVKDVVAFTFVQSFVASHTVYFGLSPVLWSLSAEAFFYAIFPFVLPRITQWSRPERRLVLLACVVAPVVVACVVQPQQQMTSMWIAYIFPPMRSLEFVAGMLLALEFRDRTFPRIDLRLAVAVVGAVYIGSGFGPQWLMWVGFAPAASVVLIGAVADRELRGGVRWLRARPLVVLGDISFCFYLVHFTVLQYLHVHVAQRTLVLAGLPLSLVLAALVHYAVERPLERRLRAPQHRLAPTPAAEAAIASPLSPA